MDKVFVEGMQFYGYHGAFPEENKLGQRFTADVVLEMDTRKAAASDHLDDTVNYAKVYEMAKHVIEGEPVSLVETLSNKLADVLLRQFPEVTGCTVKIIKPDPPIPGHYDHVAVQVSRDRSDI
ncbi:dihydroneopterin aldolase [Salisediminibacterium halotolerans]|uniref:dihydroneopterin aldolase n=1 Tax=Salisediminibacterium halotolerans TaxID=517425 RepID=UPI000EB564BC|nr:dihydroneopterin aldolase [Salisediminibacterium halotolerans]RLJ80932.1 dihydroneopterin aldolase [Actinophytocola xinjiangensis]RPE83663.1 dihydroneopterin aldolase [Salisediminibacterium halotolerans]TWG37857.1 dihydroneopterin aldolase [Salisediminibacterium halotolerans]GEL06989.1 dihydroneopterin aldolase [Salisediminibacterium halotolerans]